MRKVRELKDYTNVIFNRLTAISLIERDYKENNHLWLFQCSCGKQHKAKIKNVRNGNTSSCGCLQSEILVKRNTVHGLSKKYPLAYRSWKDLRQRCTNPNHKDFKDYGGRGIFVCEEWNSFEVFFNDMQERTKNQSIDRINVNDGYHAKNCRWADGVQQAQNKRNNNNVIVNGKLIAITQLARDCGVDRKTIAYRLKIGKTIDEAISKIDYRK